MVSLATKRAVKGPIAGSQPSHRPAPADRGEIASLDQRPQAGRLHRGQVASLALGAGGDVIGTADHPDPAVPETD